jgi:hypothetical protein
MRDAASVIKTVIRTPAMMSAKFSLFGRIKPNYFPVLLLGNSPEKVLAQQYVDGCGKPSKPIFSLFFPLEQGNFEGSVQSRGQTVYQETACRPYR